MWRVESFVKAHRVLRQEIGEVKGTTAAQSIGSQRYEELRMAYDSLPAAAKPYLWAIISIERATRKWS